jgi:hypothetical protein
MPLKSDTKIYAKTSFGAVARYALRVEQLQHQLVTRNT